jgi:hypothetical protein
MLKNIGVSYSLTPSIAKYGLTAIANSTASEEARTQLMKNGAGTQLQFELFIVLRCITELLFTVLHR